MSILFIINATVNATITQFSSLFKIALALPYFSFYPFIFLYVNSLYYKIALHSGIPPARTRERYVNS